MATEKVDADVAERERLCSLVKSLPTASQPTKERSLAKTTKFVNRLKKFFTEPSLGSVVQEMDKLDLSMYTEEVIDALSEATRSMKLRDAFAFVELCCHLCVGYPGFGEKLLTGLMKNYNASLNDNLRLRVYLRILSELVLVGVVPDISGKSELMRLFQSVLSFDDNSSSLLIRLTAVAYWSTKYCSTPLRAAFETHVRAFYESRCPRFLQAADEAIAAQEAVHAQLRIDKGSVDAENEARYAGVQANRAGIQNQIFVIQQAFGFPELVAEAPPAAELAAQPAAAEGQETVELGPFTDETEKSFYTELPDLQARLPAALLSADFSEPTSTSPFSKFASRLMHCHSRDEADDLAATFFESGFNTKANRKTIGLKFLDAEVGPNQCRFLATVAPFTPDLLPSVLAELKKKSLRQHDRAIKTLGELTKFQIAPSGMALDLLQQFANEPSVKTAEAAAWLLVSCGRFLAQSPDTAMVTDNLLARLLKWASSSATLTPKIKMAVEDAYFQAKPRLVGPSTQAVKADLERYIDYLLQVEVYRMDEDSFLRLVRQLPWESDPNVPAWVKRNVLALSGSFPRLFCLVSLLAGLVKFEEEFVVDVVDSVFELFQVTLEKEDFRQAPLRVRLARFIGELYGFKLIDSATVFDVLYQIIGFRDASSYGAGEHTVLAALHAESQSTISTILEDEETEPSIGLIKHGGVVDEPEWSYVRINLVATIVSSVGEFFLRGKNRSRMLRFLVMFRRYVLLRSSTAIPTRVINIIADMFEQLQVRQYDFRKDSLQKVEQELELVLKDLAADGADHVGGRRRSMDGDNSSSDGESSSSDDNVDSSFETCNDNEYYRHTDEEIDHELADFDREMQAMLVDSVAEARTRRGGNQVSLGRLEASRPDTGAPGGFRVMSKTAAGKAQTVGNISVPEDNKLRLGQESYRLEQQLAIAEKERLKRYIIDYERTAQSGAAPEAPTVGRPVTLGQAAGLQDGDFDLKWSNRDIKQRKNFRRF